MNTPTKVYMIACEEDRQDEDGLYGITVACHNLGVYLNETEANLRCVGLNAERLDDDDDAHTAEDYYFVLPVDVKDVRRGRKWHDGQGSAILP